MGAPLALALRLAGLGAGALGLSPASLALIAGVALGAVPAGFIALHWGEARGRAEGAASAEARAEAETLARALAEARHDAANARAAADAARTEASRNAARAATAQRRADAYARKLEKAGPAGACGLTDDDLRVLRGDAWSARGGGGAAPPSGGR